MEYGKFDDEIVTPLVGETKLIVGPVSSASLLRSKVTESEAVRLLGSVRFTDIKCSPAVYDDASNVRLYGSEDEEPMRDPSK